MRAAEPNRPNVKEPAAGADPSKTRQIMTITASIPDTESTYSSADICSGENNLIMLSSVNNNVESDHYPRHTVNDPPNTSTRWSKFDDSVNNTPNMKKTEYEYVLLSEVLRMENLPPNMFDHEGNRVPIKQSKNYMMIEEETTCGTNLMRAYWKMNVTTATDEFQDQTGEDVSVYMLRSLDDDTPPEVKPDFDKHEYVNKHLLRVKESTHVYVDDDLTIKSLGEGLFSEIDITQCTPIVNFQGKVISMCTAKKLTFPENEYIVKLDSEWVLDCKANATGESTPKCIASKSNDPYRSWCTTKQRHLTKTDANAGAIRVYDGKEYHCVLYAIKDIKAGEEIMWNYLYDTCEDEQNECNQDQAVTEPKSAPNNVHQVLTAKKLNHMDGVDIFGTNLRRKPKRT